MNPDRENLARGLSNAAWGYLFLHVDINIGTVSVLPRFVGFLLLLSAIGRLSGERRDLRLLRPLCILLAAWHGVDWLFSWAGASLDGLILPLDLIVAAATIYFHFQFLTDMAALAERWQDYEDELDRKILTRRTFYVVIITAADLIAYLPVELGGEWQLVTMIACAAAGLIAAVLVTIALFALRRRVLSDGDPTLY